MSAIARALSGGAIYSESGSHRLGYLSISIMTEGLKGNLQPDRFNMKSFFARIEKYGQLRAGFWKIRQKLEKALQKLDHH